MRKRLPGVLITMLLLIICILLSSSVTFAADVAHTGDIVLAGNDVMTIENMTYTQTGHIYVRDNAKLTITNAVLIINISYHEEFDIIISDNATLEIIGSTVKASIPWEIQRILFSGTSHLTFQGSNLSDGSAYFSFGAEGGGTFSGDATLTNSKIHNISLLLTPQNPCAVSASDSTIGCITFRFNNNYQGEFADLKPGLFASWSYTQNNYNITFSNSQINSFNAAGDGPSQIVMRNSEFHQFAPTAPSAAIQMTAIDSKINQVPLHGLTNLKASIWGLETGHYDNWRLSDHASVTQGELPVLVLQNSDIKDWWLVSAFDGSDLTLEDSTFEFRVYGANSNTKIINSAIVSGFMLYGATGSIIEFDNVSIANIDVYVPPISITMKGHVTFPSTARVTNWNGPSIIKRNYPLIVTDAFGRLKTGIPFSLEKDGTAVFSGITDENGEATFDIEFNDDNYTETWKLILGSGEDQKEIDISLLTSTPIQANLYVADTINDINIDGLSDILLQNTITGQTVLWFMNADGSVLSDRILFTDLNSMIVGTGDFNNDGICDLIKRNAASGQTVVWFMNADGTRAGYKSLFTDTNSTVIGTGDFNNDGICDLIKRDSVTGQSVLWFMNADGTRSSYKVLFTDVNSTVEGTGDFNGDGICDLIKRNAVTGQAVVWFMNANGTRASYKIILSMSVWTVAGTGDIDGDGVTDIIWRNTSTNQYNLWLMNADGTHEAPITLLKLAGWTLAGTGDFNGDGLSDLIWRSISGLTRIWFMKADGSHETPVTLLNDPNWLIVP